MKNTLMWWVELLVHTIRLRRRLEILKFKQDDGSFVCIYVIPEEQK